MCLTLWIAPSASTYSAAPDISIRVPAPAMPKNGPCAVPANFQKTAARSSPTIGGSQVKLQVGKGREPVAVDVGDFRAAVDDAVRGTLEGALLGVLSGQRVGVTAGERLLVTIEQRANFVAGHRRLRAISL